MRYEDAKAAILRARTVHVMAPMADNGGGGYVTASKRDVLGLLDYLERCVPGREYRLTWGVVDPSRLYIG